MILVGVNGSFEESSTKRCALQNCVFFFSSILLINEFVGLCIGRNTESRAEPKLKQIITVFIYFKIVSFTTSDAY